MNQMFSSLYSSTEYKGHGLHWSWSLLSLDKRRGTYWKLHHRLTCTDNQLQPTNNIWHVFWTWEFLSTWVEHPMTSETADLLGHHIFLLHISLLYCPGPNCETSFGYHSQTVICLLCRHCGSIPDFTDEADMLGGVIQLYLRSAVMCCKSRLQFGCACTPKL